VSANRIVLPGGSGFLGSAIAEFYAKTGVETVVLSRRPHAPIGSIRFVRWDAKSVEDWAGELEGARAIINLTGKSVNCRQTPENRKAILGSRVDSVHAVGKALAACANPPPLWIQASSLAIYGDPGERVCDEECPSGEGFGAEVSVAWEAALSEHEIPGVRKACLRIGFVLGRDGGALPVLLRLAKWGLGGHAGSGRQGVSWIHLADFLGIVDHVLQNDSIDGPLNVASPNPTSLRDLMFEIRRAVRRPWSPPIPAPIVRLGAALMGSDPELVLHGRRCVPQRLLDAGYAFRFDDLREALKDLTS